MSSLQGRHSVSELIAPESQTGNLKSFRGFFLLEQVDKNTVDRVKMRLQYFRSKPTFGFNPIAKKIKDARHN